MNASRLGNSWKFLLIVVLVMSYASSFWVRVKAAQGDHKLVYTKAVNTVSGWGQISDDLPEEVWTLDVPGKDVVSIIVQRNNNVPTGTKASTLVPEVEIQAPDGKAIASTSFDPDTAEKAMISELQFPAVGTYRVIVRRYQGKDGKTEGAYSIAVNLIGAGADRVDPVITKDKITFEHEGTSLLPNGDYYQALGEIRNDRWQVVYFLDPGPSTKLIIHNGTRIRFQVQRISDTLMPTLALIKVDFDDFQKTLKLPVNISPVAVAETQPDGTTAWLDYTVTEDGVYAILVARQGAEKGRTFGRFGVTLEPIIAATTPRFDWKEHQEYQLLKSGDSQTGSIRGIDWWARYQVTLTKGQPVSITVNRTRDNLIPAIYVLDTKGTELAHSEHDTSFAASTIEQFVPPADGDYYILVTRSGLQAGLTEGVFTISLATVSK